MNLIIALTMISGIVIPSTRLTISVSAATDVNKTVFLPLAMKDSGGIHTPKMLGVIAKGYWGITTNDVNTMLKGLDSWSGKKHSIVGWFWDLREQGPDYNFYWQLENLWENGYTSFINMGAGGLTASDIAQHKYDSYIQAIANAYVKWIRKGGGRRAFIAPLQEMNGYWVTYGLDPTNFKLAYDVIQQIFYKSGISSSQIWWVFAPNGYSDPSDPPFEQYYPGDNKVDIVAFSSFNFGFCPVGNPDWHKWVDYSVVLKPYVDRMRIMAPLKPIIIAQSGTSAQYPSAGVYNTDMKNSWIEDAYNYVANEPGVMALIYFDIDGQSEGECDYEIYNGPYQYNGYKTAVANQVFKYYDPASLSTMNLLSAP